MKTIILIALLVTMIVWFNSINKRLDKLIEINTPEYVNVIPDKILKE